MTDHDIHGCGRAGSAIGVLCAFLGVVCAAAIVFGLIIHGSLSRKSAPMIIFEVISLVVAAGFFGRKAGIYLCEKGNDLSRNIGVGIALAFGSIVTATATTTFVTGLLSGALTNAASWVLVGGFVMTIYTLVLGLIPAVLLGALYGLLMTGELRRRF